MSKKAIEHSRALENFTIRGKDSSRLEALSDGVFALAIALLLISSSVPSNYNELEVFIYDFFTVAVCMAFLFWIWRAQCVFFLRFGIKDGYTQVLNMLLLFFVLFYVYPLKFLLSFLFKFFYFAFGGILFNKELLDPMRQLVTTTFSQIEVQMPRLMLIYNIGFMCIFAILYLLYRHAIELAEDLRLNRVELVESRASAREFRNNVILGAISSLLAIIGWLTEMGIFAILAGMSYNLLGFMAVRSAKRTKREIAALEN